MLIFLAVVKWLLKQFNRVVPGLRSMTTINIQHHQCDNVHDRLKLVELFIYLNTCVLQAPLPDVPKWYCAPCQWPVATTRGVADVGCQLTVDTQINDVDTSMTRHPFTQCFS